MGTFVFHAIIVHHKSIKHPKKINCAHIFVQYGRIFICCKTALKYYRYHCHIKLCTMLVAELNTVVRYSAIYT